VSLDDKASIVALENDGVVVTAIRVSHGPVKPAYGYRFDFAGRSVTISGDTAPDDNLARAANDTDVLVHEALSPELVKIFEDAATQSGRLRAAKIMHDIPGYHTSPIEAAKIANRAHAKLLVFTHLLPVIPNAIAGRAFLRGVSDERPNGLTLGHDGLIVRLPAGTDRIEQASLK
jgi:ribonuclease Z